MEALESQIRLVENGLFRSICERVLKSKENLSAMAHILAEVDVSSSLASLAHDKNFVRPVIDGSK